MTHLLIPILSMSLMVQGPEESRVEGLILSVRGNIYVVRPSLRPRNVRVLISPETEVSSEVPSAMSALKPGMRVSIGGTFNAKEGFRPFFITSGNGPMGSLSAPDAAPPSQPGFGFGTGTLVSVQPFVYKTKDEKTFKIVNLERASVWKVVKTPRQDLLIGTRVTVLGKPAADGVIQAKSVSPDRGATQPGTMFAVLKRVKSGELVIRPKYSLEDVTVSIPSGIKIQREVRIEPDTVKIGQPMTLWASPRPDYPGLPKDGALIGFALLKGAGRYPKSTDATSGAYFPGAISQLEPDVKFRSNGKTYPLIVPAQFIVAEIKSASIQDLKPGQPLMLTLKRQPNGKWRATQIILNASAWVGYGS